MKRNLAPVILFCFSRKQCELEEVFNNATDKLSDEDKNYHKYRILPLKRGVGIHHSGLLPLIKEMIEILFGKSLIKVLFATETIGMGLNMPARTVVFTSVRKFDGRNSRFLTSSEYIQMSGRAGRRGFDERGIVICQIDKKNSPILVEQMICGKPETLNSAFHLTYNMVLNLSRVEQVNPEYILKHSFFNFNNI
ncbi:Exosome RNA helicase MTR4 [Dermatophagoides farinae]|uniref:Exosome RNA helicase MTR4 n=1 Tax=Dermatophagoides farinae TaxID=6954 RepID=A0A922HWM2_DERFA|nr:Exosome RNA helicase MTR4 [Dermatophagoides farinae]